MTDGLMWRKTVVQLGKSAKRGNQAREGYVTADGLVAVPPLRADKVKKWRKRMGIKED